jgi:ubiquinone/menaquinone biosynthesis C-methylase UbiE
MGFWQRRTAQLGRLLRLDMDHAQVHYAARLETVVATRARWLDVGCGRQIVPVWAMLDAEQRAWVSRSSLLVGIDTDDAIEEHPHLHARVRGLAGSLPFRDESFDLVSANTVVEHIEDCAGFLQDVRRVLKPGGRFIFHTPNYWYYLVFLAAHVPEAIKRGSSGYVVGGGRGAHGECRRH